MGQKSIQSENVAKAAKMLGCIEISILLTEQTISIPPILESRASEEGSHERMILSRQKKQARKHQDQLLGHKNDSDNDIEKEGMSYIETWDLTVFEPKF